MSPVTASWGNGAMPRKGVEQSRNRRSRPARIPARPAHLQYSLFAAAPPAEDGDARHFLRQAQLCQRLISALHQQELVEVLGRLHEEFEAKAVLTPPPGEYDGSSRD
jgi:hypothetical protein